MRCSAVPRPETLWPIFWPLCFGHMQRVYSPHRHLRALVSFAPAPAPVPALPVVVPIDIDRTQTCAFPCTCFQCRAAGHLTHKCSTMSDVRHTDILNNFVRQLGDNLSMSCSPILPLPPRSRRSRSMRTRTQWVFCPRLSERCTLSRIP
jgi:hypothetical protein